MPPPADQPNNQTAHQQPWHRALANAAEGATITTLLIQDDGTLEIHLNNGTVLLARRWYAR